MRAARQAQTMEELEIEPPERAASSGGIAGPSPRSAPGFEHNVEDTLMEYEDSDLEQEADEYRAMLVDASGAILRGKQCCNGAACCSSARLTGSSRCITAKCNELQHTTKRYCCWQPQQRVAINEVV